MDRTTSTCQYQIERAVAQLESAAYHGQDKQLIILSVIAQLQAFLNAEPKIFNSDLPIKIQK